MQKAMELHYKNRRYDKAAEVAKHLAPYKHPRLNAVTVKGDATAPPVQVRIVNVLRPVATPSPSLPAPESTNGTVPA